MNKSSAYFERSKGVMPGGVNSPARAFSSVDMDPPFIERGEGAYIYDEEGNKYLDFVGSWGPLILGHGDEDVVKGLEEVIKKGTSFGAPTKIEMEMAELMVDSLPNVEMVRMVNSGTEATMSALRLAKAFTGRSKIVKFEGNYHGHSDSLLIKAGSGALTHGVPDSLGVPEEIGRNTLTANYNDLDNLKAIFEANKEEIAAVIIEPVAGNMGVISMTEEFARGLRALTKEHGIILIYDEVMSGFRVSFQGAQSLYPGIAPDLICYGKIIGGGLPVGAFGGRKDIMSMLGPIGPVYQAGTLSGNPLAMRAGFETLNKLGKNPEFYKKLEAMAEKLEQGILQAGERHRIPVTVNRVGAMISLFFTDQSVRDFNGANAADQQRFKTYFKAMLEEGIYLPPSQFEALFLNVQMTEEDLNQAISAIDRVFSELP
ncbi:glutamate-1-semialdehyde 2,1-aminomutase [Isachenkonia alkalipeptolytica]|uniref:Glutamate-1-semialdehyde 2,1-aminomutase n=1 Tax=Isachenkonia alkalipeptolytica TaxID=2565777 RepID=A0AA43XHR6_9CLOT|nr:glutamate-1-semialdehyde 2,1-aminomutase [Isachenkonia alkalipeptolytica]NBG87098.1 glutamate-1-semialdehyde-2,1-aminomutase [Isachenkonia alkalipeptolytica]